MLPLTSTAGFQDFSVSKYTHWPTHPQPCLATVQFSSVIQSCTILCEPMDHSMPGLPVYHQLPEYTQTHVHWVSDTIQPSHPLSSSLLLLLTIFPSIMVFSNESALPSGGQNTGVSASTSVLPMNTQDWSPLGWTIGSPCSPRDSQSLLQHHSSKASILWCSAFFMVQLSHPYLTTGKTSM